MRKKIIVCVIAALCLFVSASPWEGSAAISPDGELPVNGRYIATNSFPKNTIVDIVNIETNKSTRVIVAGNLESPGLLAVVSKEAAELIGMRPGSISRIRMTQPSEPVAYARFTEGLSSGITDYDSGDVITEDTYGEEFVNPARPSRSTKGYDDDSFGVFPPTPPVASVPNAGYPAYVLEPEWTGASGTSGERAAESARDIVDLPPDLSAFGTKPVSPVPFLFDEPEPVAEKTPTEAEEYSEKIAEYFPEDYDDIYYEDDFIEEPEKVAEAVDDYADDYIDDYYNIPEDTPNAVVEFNIVPTGERPPSNIYGIDTSLIIPGITNAVGPDASNTVTNPVVPIAPVSPVNEPRLSLSEIELVRGRYYVQLASYDSAESAQNGFNRMDQQNELNFSKYEPKVYKDGDKRFQILLGPLNQGESAAVLARFKSYGYKDAFVRVAR